MPFTAVSGVEEFLWTTFMNTDTTRGPLPDQRSEVTRGFSEDKAGNNIEKGQRNTEAIVQA